VELGYDAAIVCTGLTFNTDYLLHSPFAAARDPPSNQILVN
jgi:hypothetical protein